MKKSPTINVFLFVLGFFISPLQGFTENLTALNYAEAALALARGPLAALSYRNHQKHTKIAKAVHVTTDVVRIAIEEARRIRGQGWTLNRNPRGWILTNNNGQQSETTTRMSISYERPRISYSRTVPGMTINWQRTSYS